MSKEELLKEHSDIFENLTEYALVRNPEGSSSEFTIYYKPTMGFVLIEYNAEEVKDLMVVRGVQIANSEEEIRPIGFKPYHMIWDEEKKEWRKIYEDEIARIAEERRKNKRNK